MAATRPKLIYASYVLALSSVTLFVLGAIVAHFARARVESQLEITGSWFTDHDAEIGIVLARNSDTKYRDRARDLDFSLYTDSRGMRVSAAGESSPAPADLLLVGASFVLGWGVDYEDSMVPLVARSTGLRIANASIPAVGTLSSARQIERHAELRPSWVVYGLTDYHLERNTCPCAAERAAPYCQTQTFVDFTPDRRAYARPPIESFFAPALGSRYTFDAIIRERSLIRGSYWGIRTVLALGYRRLIQTCERNRATEIPAFDFALDEMVKASRAIDAELAILYIPPLKPYASRESALARRLDELRSELPVFDMTPLVADFYDRPARSGQPLIFERDIHPTAAGQAVMAAGLCILLVQQGWVESADSCDPAWLGGAPR